MTTIMTIILHLRLHPIMLRHPMDICRRVLCPIMDMRHLPATGQFPMRLHHLPFMDRRVIRPLSLLFSNVS